MKYPIYPELKFVVDGAEIDGDAIYFDMSLDGSVINCAIYELERVEVEYDYQPDSDPQNTVGREAFYLKASASKNTIEINGGEYDEIGLAFLQDLRMTEEQESKINEFLESEWKWA